ncbi:MAG: hypothetical protein WAU90_04445 [Methyloceanibacter sp.]
MSALATLATNSIVVALSLLMASLPTSRAGLNRRVEIEFMLALAAFVSRTIATCSAPSRRLVPARDSLFWTKSRLSLA